MVTIVTGKINSHKTTKMVSLYEETKKGDGFVSIKNMQNDKVHSYTIKRLSTNQKRLLIIRDEFNNSNEPIAFQIGPYQFLKNTLDYVEEEIALMIKKGISPIYLDEIGIVEMEGKGFFSVFKRMLNSNLDICIAVRESLIDTLIEKFNIKDYKIILAS